MPEKKKPDTATLLKSDVAVALRELGLDPKAIESLPKPLLSYLAELHQQFVATEAKVQNLEGEVGSASEDLARLRRQRDTLRAALTKVEVEDPIDQSDYSQAVAVPIEADRPKPKTEHQPQTTRSRKRRNR